MTWSLAITISLTIVITLIAMGWIWAENKPPTRPKARTKASNDYFQNEGIEEE
ncbi:hypothetical protein [Candidatus Nitrospira allomarina]|jgi:hypothetical protein|uniref:Uncharacterized protein n=1 Tax=Candidatus Nitrospira allomarina TaxID=3020900 RepID=A0AA96GBW0_9BACT|nr:hypothetical protein [Candidatus Nitrospira allomarina]WNM58928.1 hypothetical protein PP769_03945 [Candidatus Nitrospira allomarina]